MIRWFALIFAGLMLGSFLGVWIGEMAIDYQHSIDQRELTSDIQFQGQQIMRILRESEKP